MALPLVLGAHALRTVVTSPAVTSAITNFATKVVAPLTGGFTGVKLHEALQQTFAPSPHLDVQPNLNSPPTARYSAPLHFIPERAAGASGVQIRELPMHRPPSLDLIPGKMGFEGFGKQLLPGFQSFETQTFQNPLIHKPAPLLDMRVGGKQSFPQIGPTFLFSKKFEGHSIGALENLVNNPGTPTSTKVDAANTIADRYENHSINPDSDLAMLPPNPDGYRIEAKSWREKANNLGQQLGRETIATNEAEKRFIGTQSLIEASLANAAKLQGTQPRQAQQHLEIAAHAANQVNDPRARNIAIKAIESGSESPALHQLAGQQYLENIRAINPHTPTAYDKNPPKLKDPQLEQVAENFRAGLDHALKANDPTLARSLGTQLSNTVNSGQLPDFARNLVQENIQTIDKLKASGEITHAKDLAKATASAMEGIRFHADAPSIRAKTPYGEAHSYRWKEMIEQLHYISGSSR